MLFNISKMEIVLRKKEIVLKIIGTGTVTHVVVVYFAIPVQLLKSKS